MLRTGQGSEFRASLPFSSVRYAEMRQSRGREGEKAGSEQHGRAGQNRVGAGQSGAGAGQSRAGAGQGRARQGQGPQGKEA